MAGHWSANRVLMTMMLVICMLCMIIIRSQIYALSAPNDTKSSNLPSLVYARI